MSEIEGLRELSADLGRMSARAGDEAEKIVKRAADNVKREMVADAGASRHFKAIAPTISYDSAGDGGKSRVYEIGPDRSKKAARLANIAYFGGANGGGGTLDIDGPLKNEEPRLMAQLDKWLGGL